MHLLVSMSIAFDWDGLQLISQVKAQFFLLMQVVSVFNEKAVRK